MMPAMVEAQTLLLEIAKALELAVPKYGSVTLNVAEGRVQSVTTTAHTRVTKDTPK